MEIVKREAAFWSPSLGSV